MSWRRPPTGELGLVPGSVDVWRARLDRAAEIRDELVALLAADERARGERIRVPAARRDFELARGLLREILGRYLAVPPGRLQFGYNRFGKPRLESRPGAEELHFNLSHSRGLVLVAVARGVEVGVDLERVRSEVPVRRLAERFFSAAERAELASLPAERYAPAFFALWTCKEAYLKARGVGISESLAGFTVSQAPGREPQLLGAGGVVPGWSLRSLAAAPGYAAALAVRASPVRLRCWDWQR